MPGEQREGSLSTRIVRALTEAGLVAPVDAGRAEEIVARTVATAGAAGRETPTPRGPRLAEVAGYVGAALVLAAIALLLAQQWERLTTSGRIGSLVAIAVVLTGATLAMARLVGPRSRLRADGGARPHLVAVLSFLAVVAAGGATGVWADTWVTPDSPSSTVVKLVFTVSLVLLLAAYLLSPHGLLQVLAAACSYVLVTASWSGDLPEWHLGLAVSTAVLALLWLALAETAAWRERTIGRLVGGAFLLAAAQSLGFAGEITPSAWVYAATFLVAVAGLALYLWRDDWGYLVVGVISLTVAVTQALLDWSGGSLGPGGAVLVAGLTLLAASGLAMRLRRVRSA